MEIVISVVGLLLAFFAFIFNQKYIKFNRKYIDLSKLKILHGLFTFYNNKYDEQNNILNMIVENKESELTEIQKKEKIKDYLNLCSEEFYWYNRGLIDQDIWENWVVGMCYFFENDFVKKIIKEEKKNKDSYYGFFEIIEKICRNEEQKKKVK